MRRRLVTLAGLALIVAAMFAPLADAGPNAGTRSVVVTVRNPSTGEKLHYPFTLTDTDRLYVTKAEAEVIHTADGTSDEVAYPAGYRLGNVAVTRVQA